MNLKQAARTLGIHYQTAYKLVRSGRLVAVRVGGAYEISDAAIARYLAERDATRRAPATPEDRHAPARTLDDMVRDIEAALDTTGASAEPVLEMVADALAVHLGDLVIVRPVAHEHGRTSPGPVRHIDPRRRAIAAAIVSSELPIDDHTVGMAARSGELVLLPHVPQDGVRAAIPPYMVQHLDDGSVHSLIAAPAKSRDDVLAVVLVTRDVPGRPYTDEDAALVSRLAQYAGTALHRARLNEEANTLRQAVMDRVAEGIEFESLLDDSAMAEVVTDAEARVVAVNDACLTLGEVQRDRNEVLGRELVELAAPEEQAHEADIVKRLLVGELPYADVRRTMVTPDGREVAVAAHHGVVRDRTSEPQALVVVSYELP